jgi:amidophosphoribosyltransferase
MGRRQAWLVLFLQCILARRNTFNLITLVLRTGEAVIITRSRVSRRQVAPPATFAPDIFEYVYFARPDSVLDGVSVYRSRMAMGDALADEVKRVLTEKGIDVDVVIPVCPS